MVKLGRTSFTFSTLTVVCSTVRKGWSTFTGLGGGIGSSGLYHCTDGASGENMTEVAFFPAADRKLICFTEGSGVEVLEVLGPLGRSLMEERGT